MKPNICVLAASTISLIPSLAPAAISLGTVATYDSTSHANVVDAYGNGTALTYAAFTAAVSTAYTQNRGGVINFDIDGAGAAVPPTGVPVDAALTVTYGASASNVMTITRPANSYQIDMSASFGAVQLSGTNYLRSTSESQIFAFGTPVQSVGFTILARTGARSGNINILYSDGSSATATPFSIATVTGSGAAASPDTFFSFEAPEGLSIATLTIAPGNGFVAIDDLAFIVIPEPSAALLSIAGLAGLVIRRRRN